MRSTIVAAVLIAPALIGARPMATPDTKMVLNTSPPEISGAAMPAEHTSPHHFANGVTDEGLKRMMGGRDKTLATPKEEIIVHPYRPFADSKERGHEHFELFEGNQKVHPRGFRQEVRNTDNTKRPHPNDHHLGPKIGTPMNARAIDNTERFPRPDGHLLPPKIGTPINARAMHDTERLTRPDDHLLPPMKDAPNTLIDEKSIDKAERPPHPDDHHLGPMIGSTMRARSIDNADRPPHPNDHHLGPKIGTPKNAKREESEESEEFEEFEEWEEFGDLQEIPVDLPISSDYYPGEFDDLEEMPVDLPISSDYYPDDFYDFEETPVDLPIPSDYYYEEFDDQEEMPMDLPILSDYYPDSSDFEDSRYIPATPGDRNSRRPGRLAGPPYPCAGPIHFNGTGFNTTINGTAFNNTINGTAFNNTVNGTAFNNSINITTEATKCLEEVTSDFEEAISDFEEPSEPTLKRREFQAAKDKASKEKGDREKALKKQALERKAREKDTREKNPNVPVLLNPGAKPGAKPGTKIDEYAPELFDYMKDPFNKAPPFEEDKEWTEDFFKRLGKPRHPLWWAQPGVEDINPPKDEPGYEYPREPKPKDLVAETGFDQGDGWKTDYFQNGVWAQPRVPKARQPYRTAEGNPVY
ncbi:hypothetical protein V500_07491 [Pseudogymnoascus sp. VKM F-4518 (FW-2643)]|nr:hypothetical protein V500_07491 [Pseudogymnoascus sp. VKM F-4518 (FW-2643)]